MRALQVVSPGEVKVVDVAAPEVKPGDALLRVRMVGMCGSDLNTFRGKNPLVSYPRILGHEIAATVEDAAGVANADSLIGSNVTVLPYNSCGQCAACRQSRFNACQFNETFGVQRDGALTEFIAVRAEKICKGDGLTIRQLALVEPLTVGFHAAARGRISSSDVVGIFGCGGVGLGAISGAAQRGATVIAIDVDDAKLRLAQAAGADFSIHSQRGPLHDRLLELTDGRGLDVVIEAIGLPETYRAAVEEVSFAGRVVYIGYTKEPVSYETRLFVQKELDIVGSRNATPDDFCAVVAMLQAGRFPVEQAISKVVSLDEAGEALAQWSEHPTKFSKILVDLDRSVN